MSDMVPSDAVPSIGIVAEPGSATVPYRVRFDEATPAGTIRTSTLLRYAQDVAWVHSEHLGYDRRWYAERSLAWLVRSLELVLLDDIRLGETLLLRTAVTGFRKVWARRRTEVRRAGDPGGTPIAWLHTDWVMTDGRGAPTRVPPDFAERFGATPGGFDPVRVVLPPPPPDAVTRAFAVRPHELDPMDHVNNSVYVDWVEEAAAGVEPHLTGAVPRRYRLEYVIAAGADDRLVTAAWVDAGAGHESASPVAVRVMTADGAEVLRATVSASDAPPA